MDFSLIFLSWTSWPNPPLIRNSITLSFLLSSFVIAVEYLFMLYLLLLFLIVDSLEFILEDGDNVWVLGASEIFA